MRGKIALIQPDSPYLLCPLAFPNLGLLYISSYLKNHGHNVEIYDLTGGVPLSDMKADIFGFSCQITQFKDVIELKNKLKKNNPNSIFVIGGPFPTHSPQECLDAGFDIVIRGEGEIPMLEVADNYPNSKLGIYQSEKFIDPNELLPDWEGINPLRYKYQLMGKRCINILTKRGNCPFHCTFCAKQEHSKSPLRLRTPENVLKEIKYLKDKFGFSSISIFDDELFLKNERDKKILKGLAELGMPYRCLTRADLADLDDLKFLKETGCAEVCVGIESVDEFIHDKVVKKGTTIKQDADFIKNCKAIGLRVKAYLIIGLPSESLESVNKIKDWLRETKPDHFDISIFTPYPGSDIYENKQNYDIEWDGDELRESWFSGKAQYEGCAVSTSHLSSQEIEKLKKEIEEEFGREEGGITDYWGPIKDEI